MYYGTSISDIFLLLVILLVLTAIPVILNLFEIVDKKYPRKRRGEVQNEK